jgi:copper chaperone CopZ
MTPAAPPASGTATPSGSTTTMVPAINKQTKMVSMKVSMTCPHGCYPTVKETLEGLPGVEGVTLAEQKDPDTIDNPVVYVSTTSDFDSTKAIEALKEVRFDSEVLN